MGAMMDRQVALKRLRKMFGKQFAFEYHPDAPTEEEREEAKRQHVELVAARKVISDAMTARRQALLQDAEYQRLAQEYKQADRAVTAVNSKIYSHKFTVGTVGGMGRMSIFHVRAQGNSWEDIFAKLEKENNEARNRHSRRD